MWRKQYQRRFVYLISSLWYGIVSCDSCDMVTFTVSKTWKLKMHKLGKVDDRIPVLQVTRSRSKKEKEADIWIEKDGEAQD